MVNRPISGFLTLRCSQSPLDKVHKVWILRAERPLPRELRQREREDFGRISAKRVQIERSTIPVQLPGNRKMYDHLAKENFLRIGHWRSDQIYVTLENSGEFWILMD